MMQAHGISLLLTLNADDFAGYPDITLVEPGDIG